MKKLLIIKILNWIIKIKEAHSFDNKNIKLSLKLYRLAFSIKVCHLFNPSTLTFESSAGILSSRLICFFNSTEPMSLLFI